jgi:hypothetical protein
MSPRFSFLPPSVGDRLLSGASSAKITFSRWPSGADDRVTDCEFELRGEIPLTADQAGDMLAALIKEFRSPRLDRGEEGGASC